MLASRLSAASVSEGATSDGAAPDSNKLAAPVTAEVMAAAAAATATSPAKMKRVGTVRAGGGGQHSCINRVTRETKTAGTLAVVVGGFVACWLPFFILYLATPFIPAEPPDPLMPALTWLGE